MAGGDDASLFAPIAYRHPAGRVRKGLEDDVRAARTADAAPPAALLGALRSLADQIDQLERALRSPGAKPYDRVPLAGLVREFGDTYAAAFAGVHREQDPLTRALADFTALDNAGTAGALEPPLEPGAAVDHPTRPHAPTDGAAGAFVAHLARRPWLPWQRHVADVIGERTPTGGYRYPLVVVTVPRQCGKTTWALDLALGRALQMPDYRVAYTAQTGHVTTERMADRFLELADGPLAGLVRLRRSQGTERMTLPARSHVKAFPPKAGALRGSALDLVIVDEAQEHATVLGEQLDLTILPTFTTRPRRQLILVGTAGTDASDYLRRYLDAARERRPGFAVFEWGATDHDDPDNETVWWDTHPGLGRLTDPDALRQARQAMGPAGFAREYLNVWSRTSVRVIDPVTWAACQDPHRTPTGRPCLALDVAPDRTVAAVAVATLEPGGRPHVEMVDTRPGIEWLAGRVLELQAAHRAPIAVSRYGAAGVVVDDLERAGAELLPMTSGDTANAAAGFRDAVHARNLTVHPSRVLADAVEGAAQRPIGDTGGWVWARAGSAAPVAPLVAASAALWGARHLPDLVKPAVHAG